MVPDKYIIEFDDCLYGPFDTPEAAFKYANDRGYFPVGIIPLKTP